MCVTFDPSDGIAQDTIIKYSHMSSGVIWKTIFTEHGLTLHQEMPLESLLRKEKAVHQFYAASSGPELVSDGLEDSGNVCCGQMSPCFSLFFGRKWESSQSQRRKGPTRLTPATGAKANICPGVEEHHCKRYG